MKPRYEQILFSPWTAALAIVLVISSSLIVGRWAWISLTLLESELPQGTLRRQGDLSALLLAISRAERAASAVSAEADLVNRNELILALDYLQDQKERFWTTYRENLPELHTVVEELKGIEGASEDLPAIFRDPAAQYRLRDRLTYALHQLTRLYLTRNQALIAEVSGQRRMVRQLRTALVSTLVILVLFTPALAGILLAQWRTKRHLRQAKGQAEEANRAKSLFLATMSHEIRTPLNGLLGMTQLLAQSELTPKQSRQVQAMAQAGEHLSTTLNAILDLSKIEAGKLVLELAPFALPTLLHGLIELFTPLARQKGLHLHGRFQTGLPPFVVGDAARLRQILANLLGNAIKFTHQGEVCLEVGAEPHEAGEVVLRFAVSDTGIGIDAQRQCALFSPFVQEDASTTRRYGGSGLGLAICRELARTMGGEIGLISTKGEGSRFTLRLTLPLGRQPETSVDAMPPHPLSILVVEDEPINCEVLEHLLKSDGHTVRVVHNGPDALEELEWSPVQVVLMDLRMPGMDGVETTRRLRAREDELAGLPVFMLTADVTTEVYQRCREVGVNRVFAKPLRLPRLREALAAVHLETVGEPVAEETTPSEALLDHDTVISLHRAMGKSELIELVRRFLAQVEEQCLRMGQMAREGNVSNLRELAHGLKGTAAFLGLNGLMRLSEKLELAAATPRREANPFDSLLARHLDLARQSVAAVEHLLEGGR
ncbi:MAG: response regulator [Magnetococcales bacterium]|nr:response regulator [Magnetococcales bacterium]